MINKLLCSHCGREIDISKPFTRAIIFKEPTQKQADQKDMSFHTECFKISLTGTILNTYKDYRSLEPLGDEFENLRRHYSDLAESYGILQYKYSAILQENDELQKNSKLATPEMNELYNLRSLKKAFEETRPLARTIKEIEQSIDIVTLRKEIVELEETIKAKENLMPKQQDVSQNYYEKLFTAQGFFGEILGCTTRFKGKDAIITEIASLCQKASKELCDA
ncbi:MAG: hypothetical protein WCG95_00225 [bacterium]